MDFIFQTEEKTVTVWAYGDHTFRTELLHGLLLDLLFAAHAECEKLVTFSSQSCVVSTTHDFVNARALQIFQRLGCVKRGDRSWQSELL